jgi:hypothetical protein
MTEPTSHEDLPSPQHVVLGMALGYLPARALHVAVNLGVADALRDGPRSVADLASATGAHAPSLQRLLRTLAAHGVFAEREPGCFELTPAAAVLRKDTAGSVHDAVQMIGDMTGDGPWWSAVGHLRHSVMTGQPGWDYVVDMPFFEYLARHPKAGAWFDRGLANFTTVENAAIASAYDFSWARRVIDVGGGQGGFLAEILTANPHISGLLCDQAQVLNDPAPLAQRDLLDRCERAAIDFFQSVPGGGDVYLLKRILHDWNDEHCVRILRSCRAAMHPQSRLLVVDVVLPAGNSFHPGKIMDMLMMALLEGQERSEPEFAELLRQTNLQLTRVIPTSSMLAIVEAAPV